MPSVLRWSVFVVALTLTVSAAEPARDSSRRVRELKVTILSTMLADGDELGEWGFAALVEADGHRILFDTGAKTDVVLKNARTLNVDLTTVPDVILSHWHDDHLGGFMTLRDAVRESAPRALGRTHVGAGIFASRRGTPPGVELNPMVRIKPQYEESGGRFVVHARPVELYPGVWLSGTVPRKHPERNWSGRVQVQTTDGWAEDTIPDDLALVINTEPGLVIITGCGHAGVINIIEHARSVVRATRIHALVGGIHLFNASDATLAWTAEKLRGIGLDHFIGAHCTGLETVYHFRRSVGLERTHCVVGAVGARFEVGRGIEPRVIAR